MNTIVNCPSNANANCYIMCTSDQSCKSITIRGGENQYTEVSCNAYDTCRGALINAKDSSELRILRCNSVSSCIGMTIWCPPNLDGDKKCTIEGM